MLVPLVSFQSCFFSSSSSCALPGTFIPTFVSSFSVHAFLILFPSSHSTCLFIPFLCFHFLRSSPFAVFPPFLPLLCVCVSCSYFSFSFPCLLSLHLLMPLHLFADVLQVDSRCCYPSLVIFSSLLVLFSVFLASHHICLFLLSHCSSFLDHQMFFFHSYYFSSLSFFFQSCYSSHFICLFVLSHCSYSSDRHQLLFSFHCFHLSSFFFQSSSPSLTSFAYASSLLAVHLQVDSRCCSTSLPFINSSSLSLFALLSVLHPFSHFICLFLLSQFSFSSNRHQMLLSHPSSLCLFLLSSFFHSSSPSFTSFAYASSLCGS